MKNIIVVGDSFCSYSEGWPRILANELNLNLICHGDGGQPWWNARNFITKLPQADIDNAEFIVFAHTNAERLPTLNKEIGRINHAKKPESEIETAIHLYYKYIHDGEFITWAHQHWFKEITERWGHKKLCHLHCFPWSLKYSNLLTGLNITTNLSAVSLNERGSVVFDLFHDNRSNHFNQHNNNQLGMQLAEYLPNYSNKSIELDISKFDQQTNFWLTRGDNWD